MDAKLEKILEQIGQINITLAKQEAQLAEHIRRTQLLEDQVVPLQKQSNMVLGILAFVSLLSVLATIYSALK